MRNRIERRMIAAGLILGTICLAFVSGCSKGPEQRSPITDPNRQASICANQLKMYASAKKVWAEQNHKTADDTPTMQDIEPFIEVTTNCPGGGTYTLGKVGELPTCSIAAHQEAFLKKMQGQSGQGQTPPTQ